MRHVVFVALVGVAGALLATTPADVAPSRETACLDSACRPVAAVCFEGETPACPSLRECVEPCAEGDAACLAPCLKQVDAPCAVCMQKMLACGRKHCPDEVAP